MGFECWERLNEAVHRQLEQQQALRSRAALDGTVITLLP